MEVKFNRDGEKLLSLAPNHIHKSHASSKVPPASELPIMSREPETPNWCLGVLHYYSPSFPDFPIAKVLKRPISTRVHIHSFMAPDRHQVFAHWHASSTITVFPPPLSPSGQEETCGWPRSHGKLL